MLNKDILNTWLIGKCIPIVRELTFENAEVALHSPISFHMRFAHVFRAYYLFSLWKFSNFQNSTAYELQISYENHKIIHSL